MANARMLHKKISLSLDVNKLPIEAQLLFTWLIPHTDDEGRLKGEPEYVKATVVPMKVWSFQDISKYLNLMNEVGLIHYWKEDRMMIIQLQKWGTHQTIRKDRFIPSPLPSYKMSPDNQMSTTRQTDVNRMSAQANIKEVNVSKVNISEDTHIADKSFDPDTFEPQNADEYAAFTVWKELEPENKGALQSTYLGAVRKGIHDSIIFQFRSEIKIDNTIKNPGKIFNAKVRKYLESC